MHIENLACLPMLEHAFGILNHSIAVAIDPRSSKSWRCQTPLLMPELPLAGEQPLTEDGLDMAPEESVLDEILMVLDQNVFHQVRMIEEHGWPSSQAKADNVTILARALREEAYGLLALELIVPGGVLLVLFEEEPC